MSSCSSGRATSSAERPRLAAAGVSRARVRRALALALALDSGVDSFLRLAIASMVIPVRTVLKRTFRRLDSAGRAGAISPPPFNPSEEGLPVRLNRLFTTVALASMAGAALAAGPAAKVTDLAWMTGTWSGALGPNTLEENWTAPANGSLGSLVRMTGPNGVAMWEVITIEEKNGSLEMRIQQWGAGSEPRSPSAQKMELAEIGDKRVKFNAVTDGTFKWLAYSLGADGSFNIEGEQAGGNVSKLTLKGRK